MVPCTTGSENASNRFLRVGGKNFEIDSLRNYHGMSPDDIIVDDYDEMRWKMNALYGLHNLLGKKIVALGGASGKTDFNGTRACTD